jgi:hypothetical protein
MAVQPDRRLYFVTVRARPRNDDPKCVDFGGAYVNCWVDEPSEDAAVARADAQVRESGWIPEAITDIATVTRRTYERNDQGRDHFEQALSDGVVLVFHTFPHQPEEGEGTH